MHERFGGKVEAGKLVLDEPARWRGRLACYTGKRVIVTVEREKKNRSLAQNRFYWAMVIPIYGEWAGEEKNEAHETLKSLHLMVEKVLPTGELVRKPGSTRVLSTVEFSAYVERVCTWLAQQGVYVPPPGASMETEL